MVKFALHIFGVHVDWRMDSVLFFECMSLLSGEFTNSVLVEEEGVLPSGRGLENKIGCYFYRSCFFLNPMSGACVK